MAAKDRALAVTGMSAMTANPQQGRFELLFDSLAQSGNDGIRTSVVVSRQLLFRIGSIFLDVELDKEVNSDRVSLTGQMVESSNPGHPPVGIPVVLLQRGKGIVRTLSNDNGEFQFDFIMRRDLKLEVTVDRSGPVRLPIKLLPAQISQSAN